MSEGECPHCGKLCKDLWDYGWESDDESIESECGYCEKPIVIRRVLSVDYYIDKDKEQQP